MSLVSLRKVLKKDLDYILNLRNNEQFRSYFYSQHNISKKEHYQFLMKQDNNPNFFNWIICYKSKDVGYVRILDNDVSIMIDEKFQRKGIGSQALSLLEDEAKEHGIGKLIGKIMIHNEKSEKIFLKNGYKLKMLWYEKDIK